ncbi:hypothetical protein ACHAQJ_006827 [Trichoderma viride]
MEPTRIKVVFFDLDGTLFDHYHSLRLAISAVQRKYTGLAGKNVEELIDKYNVALQRVYDAYLDKVITYEEADIRKICLLPISESIPLHIALKMEKYKPTRYPPTLTGHRFGIIRRKSLFLPMCKPSQMKLLLMLEERH